MAGPGAGQVLLASGGAPRAPRGLGALALLLLGERGHPFALGAVELLEFVRA